MKLVRPPCSEEVEQKETKGIRRETQTFSSLSPLFLAFFATFCSML